MSRLVCIVVVSQILESYIFLYSQAIRDPFDPRSTVQDYKMLGSVDDLLARLSALPGDGFLPALTFALRFAGFICHVQEACIRGNPPS